MELRLDVSEMRKRLSRLSPARRCAFVLSCCERMFPRYERFCDDERLPSENKLFLRTVVDLGWSALAGNVDSASQLRRAENARRALEPDPGEHDSLYVSAALDAVVSIGIMVDAVANSNTTEVAEVATLAVDSVDLLVQETEKMNPSRDDLEEAILQHPMMQKELRSQREDLALVAQWSERESIDQLKCRLLARPF